MRQKQSIISLFLLSPSSRRAWIEIYQDEFVTVGTDVALLAEGVDRNLDSCKEGYREKVALLAEGVDRNINGMKTAEFSGSRPPRGGRG